MSMMYLRLGENNITIAADTRVANTLPNGKPCIMPEECDKLMVIGNAIIFKTGNVSVINAILGELLTPIDDTIDLSNKHISETCQKWHNIYIENCKQQGIEPDKLDDGVIPSCGLVLARYDDKADKMTVTYFMPHSDFKPQHIEARENMMCSLYGGCWDMWTPNAQEWINKNEIKYADKIALIRGLYKHCNNEYCGGHLQVYSITKDGVYPLLFEEIPDKEHYLKVTANQLFLHKDIQLQWDNAEGVLTENLPDVALSGNYADLKNKPTIPTLPSYIKSTKITSTTIESPTITGGTITGGKMIGGEFIDDSKIGKLVLSSDDNKFADMTFSKNGKEMFKIYDGVDFVGLNINGISVGHSGQSKKFYADGTWNFSGATVEGLKVTFG